MNFKIVIHYILLSFFRDFDALLHVIKSSLGSGILAMPDAFKNSGLIFGLIGTILVGILCTHGTYLIVSLFMNCIVLLLRHITHTDIFYFLEFHLKYYKYH